MDQISEMLLDEDISILATTHVPSTEEANAIRSRNMMRRDQISSIDGQIAALHEPRIAEGAIDAKSCDTVQGEEDVGQTDEIATLRSLRHRLVKACDIGDAILAPVRRIPEEILAEIFVLSIPPPPSFSDPAPNHRWKDLPHRPFVHYENWPDPLKMTHHDKARDRLGEVCRIWRTILNNEPRVWSTVALGDPLPSPEVANRLLERTNPHPLDVYIQPHSWFLHNAQPGAAQAVLATLRKQLWRVRFLFANMFGCDETMTLFPPGFSMEFPMMEDFVYLQNPAVEGPDLGAFHCPELRSIAVVLCEHVVKSLIVNPFRAVHYLEVGFITGQEAYLELLRAMPDLVYLVWNAPGFVQEVPEELPKVALRSLKSLSYITSERASTMSCLASLWVPSLETLDIQFPDTYDPTHMVQDTIGVICGDGTVKLRRLHICGGSLNEPDIGTILGHLDHLKILSIDSPRGEIDSLLRALMPDNADISHACPHLTTLELAHMPEMFEMQSSALGDFVCRREATDDDFENFGDETNTGPTAIPGSCVTNVMIHLGIDDAVANLRRR